MRKNRWVTLFFWRTVRQEKVQVIQKIRIVWIALGDLSVPQMGFICPPYGSRFFKLYIGDDKYNREEFGCRKGYGFAYASQFKKE